MKKIFLFVFLLVGFLHQTGANPICIVNTEEPSVGIGINDLIIVSDVDKIAQYSKLKNLSERALDQVKIGNDDTSKPLFKISMECIPPSSVVDFVE